MNSLSTNSAHNAAPFGRSQSVSLSAQSRAGRWIYRALLVALCSLPLAGQALPTSKVTLFEGARLILGDGNAPIESSAFIVENDRFTSVGRRGELRLPPGAGRVDLTGKTVMPAMVDVHSHLGFLKQLDGSMSKANFNR